MAGVSARRRTNMGRGLGADIRADAAFSGLLHRWEKVRKFAGHSARKVREHAK